MAGRAADRKPLRKPRSTNADCTQPLLKTHAAGTTTLQTNLVEVRVIATFRTFPAMLWALGVGGIRQAVRITVHAPANAFRVALKLRHPAMVRQFRRSPEIGGKTTVLPQLHHFRSQAFGLPRPSEKK
jgi:hypothetical protein